MRGDRIRRWVYRPYRLLYRQHQWRLLHMTPAGLFLTGGMAAAAILGVDTRRTMSYQVFALLLAVLVISFLASRIRRPRFSAERLLPRFATAGEPLTYTIRIRLERGGAGGGMTLHDLPEDPRPSLEAFLSTPEPGEERRNVYDRLNGYYRWLWLIGRRRIARIDPRPLPVLRRDRSARVRMRLHPERRGIYRFGGLAVARPDPLGLFNGVSRQPRKAHLTILPRRYPLPRYDLPGTRRFQSGGVSLTSSVGESEEFVSLRDYRPGDPLRRIHWKSWARVRKPVVKEYREEYFVRHALILDTFQRAAYSDAFEEAVSVAASFACTARTQESLLDVMFVGERLYCFTSGRGLGLLERTLEVLATVQPCRDRPFSTLSDAVMRKAGELSGCICVLLAWDAPRRNLVGRLRAAGLPVMVLVIDGAPGAAETDAAAFGPMADSPGQFHRLAVGDVAAGLARIGGAA